MLGRVAKALCAAVIVFAGYTLVEPPAKAFGTCCEEGNQCFGLELCCPPAALGALPCSQSKPNYCIAASTCLRVEG